MRFLMELKQALGHKLLLAYVTRVRFFPCMIPHVYRKSAPLTETFRASCTLIRLNLRVYPLVHGQQLSVNKFLSALVARVRFFPRVPLHVVFQAAEVAQAFAANFAYVLVRSVVALHVVQVRVEVLQDFRTHGANEFFLYVIWFVGQHVRFVVVLVPEFLVALVANVSNASVLCVDVLFERSATVVPDIAVVTVEFVVLQVFVFVYF